MGDITILNDILTGCLVLWAMARVLEVWLKVHERISILIKEWKRKCK